MKSFRTAFIRVTQDNNTNEGLVTFSKLDIHNILKNWENVYNYWFIVHNADVEDSNVHYHIVIKFKNPMPMFTIKNKFPYGKIENARSIKNCVQYLIHFNDKSKQQYNWDDIITNCDDMTPFKILTSSQQEVTIYKILEDIDNGIIREYNQYINIPIELWSKHKNRIENALTYYKERIYMDKNREIEVIFLSGDTGTGKTSFAKQYCEGTNKSFCISSSSNDVMQDYKGEDILILDDLRDSDFSFTDLLKILDNHTKSSVKSRFHNKAFIGEKIIITSYRPITDWYFNLEKENKLQLYRRIKTWYKFNVDDISIFQFDEKTFKYVYVGKIPNIIKQKQNNVKQIHDDIYKVFGVELDNDIVLDDFVSIDDVKEINSVVDLFN